MGCAEASGRIAARGAAAALRGAGRRGGRLRAGRPRAHVVTGGDCGSLLAAAARQRSTGGGGGGRSHGETRVGSPDGSRWQREGVTQGPAPARNLGSPGPPTFPSAQGSLHARVPRAWGVGPGGREPGRPRGRPPALPCRACGDGQCRAESVAWAARWTSVSAADVLSRGGTHLTLEQTEVAF